MRILKSLLSVLTLINLVACQGSESKFNNTQLSEDRLEKIKERGQIIIGIKPDSPPFAFVNPKGEYIGLEVDIARYITRKILGSEEKVQFVPVFDASQRRELFKQDRVDLIIAGVANIPENEAEIALSEPYYASGIGLLTRKDNDINNWQDLQGETICTIQGANYNSSLEGMDAEILALRSFTEVFIALRQQNCIGFAYYDSTIIGILRDPEWSGEWRQALPTIRGLSWSVAMARGEAHLKQAVDNAITKMEAEEFILAGQKKWDIPPTQYTIERSEKAKLVVDIKPLDSSRGSLGEITQEISDLNLNDQNILIDGSRAVLPLSQKLARLFMDERPEVKIAVGSSGTEVGLAKFCAGDLDIVNTDRPISQEKMELCEENGIEYLEVPFAFDGIVVVVNPENNWAKCLDISDLGKIWSSKATYTLTNWQQIDKNYPEENLSLFGRGNDSGLYRYFIRTVAGNNDSGRRDYYTQNDQASFAQAIADNKNSLGFTTFANYSTQREKLHAVGISNDNKKCVRPNVAAITDGTYNPLSRPLFVYVNQEAFRSMLRVRVFTNYLLKRANSIAIREAGYVPLPPELLFRIQEHVAKVTTGSVFDGESAMGLNLAEKF